jgi:hypothetical protein
VLITEDILKKMTFKFDAPYGEDRLKELILYIGDKCKEDPAFGATKLNKILYFADFISFSRYGDPVTGVEYMRLGQGPAPKHLLPISRQMQADKELFIEKRDYFGRDQLRAIPMREANLNLFKPRDIAMVDEQIAALWGENADRVSERSHGIAWKMFEDKESIPYEASYLSNSLRTNEDVDWAQELITKYGW